MDKAEKIAGGLGDAMIAFVHEFTSFWLLVQLGLIVLAAGIGTGAAVLLRRRVDTAALTQAWPPLLQTLAKQLADNLGTVIFVLIMTGMRAGMQSLTWPSRSYLLGVAASLATAWVVIALFAGLIRNPFVNRLVAVFAWSIAALSILDLLQPTMAALDSVAVVIGGMRISPLLALKTSALLVLALWAAMTVSDFLEKRVRNSPDLTPSIQVLIGKLIRLAFITLAVLIVMSTVGIDLSAFAFFSGAVGVGVGFGLQKIVSNLVSGIILLADKSIKPGDIITVGDQFGWVTNMGARFTAVDTRVGREILIPNEDFITQHVVNWTYSNRRMMLVEKFGVSYDSNPHHVLEVAAAAAASVLRVIDEPAPVCYFEEFGDSSLNFSVRFWIADPGNGIINVRASVMLALWDAFKREGIEIPYPVRDVRISQPAPAATKNRKK